MLFRDRDEAGEMLADVLLNLRGAHPLVLGIPPGGVLVARVVADRLGAPLGALAAGSLEGTPLTAGALSGRTVIVVDEGIDTGATMQAALEKIAAAGPAHVVAAVPIAPQRHRVSRLAADLYAVVRPDPGSGIRRWYARLPDVTADEVRAALGDATQDWAYAGATSL
ncbi:phosphoribosyltransferase family protein [Gryllotalpicola koreensis]|uniref:Phosphoribosyltransferase domain-containing protein n=1 Tax=Gryllotalpicola koreensis TaxID=993086 RepID=A0ABP7ZXB0_9MICO